MSLRIELDGSTGHLSCSGLRLGEFSVLERIAARLRDCTHGSDHETITAEGAFYRATEAVANVIDEVIREAKVTSTEE